MQFGDGVEFFEYPAGESGRALHLNDIICIESIGFRSFFKPVISIPSSGIVICSCSGSSSCTLTF